MSLQSIRRRLAVLESDPPPGGMMFIRIRGGLPGREPTQALSGTSRWNRLPGEALADFEQRAMSEASRAGCPFVTLGGLPLADGDKA